MNGNDNKYIIEKIEDLQKTINKHDTSITSINKDINELKMQDFEIKIELQSIKSSQNEVKAMINETNSRMDLNSTKQSEIIKELINTIKEDKNTDGKIKMSNKKGFWTAVGAVSSAIIIKMIEIFINK